METKKEISEIQAEIRRLSFNLEGNIQPRTIEEAMTMTKELIRQPEILAMLKRLRDK